MYVIIQHWDSGLSPFLRLRNSTWREYDDYDGYATTVEINQDAR